MSEARDITAQDAQTAAQLSADVSVEHIAAVYAKALLGAAEKTADIDAAMADFRTLAEEVLPRFPQWAALLGSILVSVEDKAGMLDRTLGGHVAPVLLNFLKVVARHGRLDLLRSIYRQARLLDDQRRGRVPVELRTAAPVDAELGRRLAEKLRVLIGGEPIVTQVVDPEVIGGAIVRVGDTVFDGSIANQLQLMREQMRQRSAHEIQSRRDRFRHPAGN